eukprot:15478477-Alexandrium_andersonii.AAC.1
MAAPKFEERSRIPRSRSSVAWAAVPAAVAFAAAVDIEESLLAREACKLARLQLVQDLAVA